MANTTQHGYPRPQLERADWTSLNGPWDFALDPDAKWRQPADVEWNATIQVPYAPETEASGIHHPGFFRACWYRRTFEAKDLKNNRLIIHFGAVDHSALVWLNDRLVLEHEGGYTPFCMDVTTCIKPDGPNVLVVRAYDDPADLAKPRGKQDWQLEPHSISRHRVSRRRNAV